MAALLFSLLACGGGRAPSPAPAPAAPPSPSDPMPIIETIDETTVGDLAGTPVPMGNMTTGTYTLPDGSTATGPICSLALPGGPGVFVGVGSEVEVGGHLWRVVAVEKTRGELGRVTLQQVR